MLSLAQIQVKLLPPIDVNIEKRILQVNIMVMNNVEMAFIIFPHTVTIDFEIVNDYNF